MAAVEFGQRIQSDDEWMENAACLGLTNIFFPAIAERPQTRERREEMARSVCMDCSVLETCRTFARENHEYGFWGENLKKNGTLRVIDSSHLSVCGHFLARKLLASSSPQ